MVVQQALYSLNVSPDCLAPTQRNVRVLAVAQRRRGRDWEVIATAPACGRCSLAVVGAGEEG